MSPKSILTLLCGVLFFPATGTSAEFELKDGDRVVLLGNTLIEREQRYGYWETALTAYHPKKNIVYRNLGWSGDTVLAEARAGFDRPADGFRRMIEHIKVVKPTVILIAYGTNESFEGEKGVEKFVSDYEKLLTALAPIQARIALLSPTPHEKIEGRLPDPAPQNSNLRIYSEAIRKLSQKNKLAFVDLFTPLSAVQRTEPLTDNGMHYTSKGYAQTVSTLVEALGWTKPEWRIEVAAKGEVKAINATVKLLQSESLLALDIVDQTLPFIPDTDRILKVENLKPAMVTLKIDGKDVITASSADWAKGVKLTKGPSFEQSEELRKRIVEKNLQYFYRWRPQNETYLFGFRKHEQGRNAKEVAEFELIVAAEDLEIAKLRAPKVQRFEFVEGSK